MTTEKKGTSLAGFWVLPWALWHLAWLAGMFVVPPLFGGAFTLSWFTWLYAAFLPLELAGVYDLRDDKDPRRAKTLSQWRQYVAERAKPGTHGALSWKGLAGGSGIFDGTMVGLIVLHNFIDVVGGPAAGAVGVIIGATMTVWLVPHFGWSEKTW